MDNQLVLATKNAAKRREMEALLSGSGWRVLTLKDYPDCPDVIEDGETFLDNAAKKAREISLHTGLLAVADDSGLEVEALGNRPGVYSARYARGEGSTDEENNAKVLEEMREVPDERRHARFVCAAAAAAGGEVLFTAEERVEGYLTRRLHGTGGFGYDPLFYYPPYKRTFAELLPEDKNRVSHRGKAMREVAQFLRANIQSLKNA